MSALEWLAPEGAWTVEGEGVRLRPPRRADYQEWAELRSRSRDFLQPWEPTWPSDDLTRSAFRRRLDAYARERAAVGLPFPGVPLRATSALVGGLSLSNVRAASPRRPRSATGRASPTPAGATPRAR